jgi:CBS-domain-containing membrane protein
VKSRRSKATPRAKALSKAGAPKSGKSPRSGKRVPVAADVMASPAVCCHEHDSLNEAARLMWEHDVGALPVVNQARTPVGMITDRDACMAAYTQGVALVHGAVASAMSKTLVTCDVSAPVAEIRELMTRAQVRRLPVVDASGTLVGVVGLSDLVKEAHAPLPKDRRRGTSGPMLVQLVDALFQPKAD